MTDSKFTPVPSEGLSLRDYFAANALHLNGLVVNAEVVSPETIAKRCFEMADAMLAVRGASAK